MIKKILNIQNVGIFKKYSNSNDAESFATNTVVFGKNTAGKSTLSAIFRSVSTGNVDIVIGRKSFDTSGNQEIQLETSEGIVRFTNNKWSQTIPIKIFDSKYISNNIFTNELIDSDKREQLRNIILGEEGKRIEQSYDKVREKISLNSIAKSKMTTYYGKAVGIDLLSFEKFRNLQLESDLEDRIKKVNDQIAAEENRTEVAKELEQIKKVLNLPLVIEEKCLLETIEVQQELIKTHIESHFISDEGATDFIQRGTMLLKDPNISGERCCVFCGQRLSVDAEELIAEYSKLFSKKYRELQSNVKDTLYRLRIWTFSRELVTCQNKLNGWGINLDFGQLNEEISRLVVALIKELEIKEKDLNYSPDLTGLNQLREAISNYLHEEISPLEAEFLGPGSNEKLNSLINDLSLLKLKERRQHKEWIELCAEYKKLEDNYERLKIEETELFDKRLVYSKKILHKYQGLINDVLAELEAKFKLVDFRLPRNRHEKIELFTIQFVGSSTKVSLDGQEKDYTVQNTLSDSDRRLLAFGFFITELLNTEDLNKFIVVLDDPVSSYDKERKLITAKFLRNRLKCSASNLPDQLIILTHDEEFFRYLSSQFNRDSKFLRIGNNRTRNSAKLQLCNVNEEFIKPEYFKQIDLLNGYISGANDECNPHLLRIVLEHAIRTKYYIKIPPEAVSNGHIVQWYYNTIANSDLKTRIKNIFPHVPHHDDVDSTIQFASLSDGDKKNVVREFFLLLTCI